MTRVYKLLIDDDDYEDVMVEEDEYTSQLLDSIDALADTYTRAEFTLKEINHKLNIILDFISMVQNNHSSTNNSKNGITIDEFDNDLDNSNILF